jgi:hypothetical protein
MPNQILQSSPRFPVAAGVYTPQPSGLGNLSAATGFAANWMQIGKMVYVSGTVDADPVAINTQTYFELPLPRGTAMSSFRDLSGGGAFANSPTGSANPAIICYGNVTNNTAYFDFYATINTNQTISYWFMYVIR